MAEALAAHLFPDNVQSESAGSKPSTVNPYTIKVLNELNIDISRNKSKSVNVYNNNDFDYVITLCGNPEDGTCPIFLGKTGHTLHWPFPDPADVKGTGQEILNEFRKLRDAIKERLKQEITNFLKD